MRKVFLSFLGTNDYLPCNYQIAGHDPVANVRFVQEACIARWCVDWGSDDRIFLCVTDESHARNWVDNGHSDREGNILERQGLESRLEALHLAAPVKSVKVPAGRSEEEIWDIFEQVFSLLEEGDQLYLDITHAFRSLPMLAMVILSYAKVMRTVSVRAISYGALEALGSVGDVINLPVEERNVPVFDLLPFDRLQDWVTAVDRFTATGDGKMIRQLSDQDIGPLLSATKGKHADAAAIRNLGKALTEFSAAIATCRGRSISACSNNLLRTLGKAQDQETVKPLRPLLHKLVPALSAFTGQEITDGLVAARWCLDHALYQQGYTILQETIITCIVNTALDRDGRERTDRELVNQAVKILKNDLPVERWKALAQDNRETTEKILDWLANWPDIVENMHNLSNIRNDLNHAGQNEGPMKADAIHHSLGEYIDKMEHALAEVYGTNACGEEGAHQ